MTHDILWIPACAGMTGWVCGLEGLTGGGGIKQLGVQRGMREGAWCYLSALSMESRMRRCWSRGSFSCSKALMTSWRTRFSASLRTFCNAGFISSTPITSTRIVPPMEAPVAKVMTVAHLSGSLGLGRNVRGRNRGTGQPLGQPCPTLPAPAPALRRPPLGTHRPQPARRRQQTL